MDESNLISIASKAIGTPTALARGLGVSTSEISQWAKGHRPVPLRYVAQIELLTHGAVTRRDLRPKDWHLIWPELAHQVPPACGSTAQEAAP